MKGQGLQRTCPPHKERNQRELGPLIQSRRSRRHMQRSYLLFEPKKFRIRTLNLLQPQTGSSSHWDRRCTMVSRLKSDTSRRGRQGKIVKRHSVDIFQRRSSRSFGRVTSKTHVSTRKNDNESISKPTKKDNPKKDPRTLPAGATSLIPLQIGRCQLHRLYMCSTLLTTEKLKPHNLNTSLTQLQIDRCQLHS
jgi:hypothetical protein